MQVALEVPAHEPITRRAQFRVKQTIKEERLAKKGKGKGNAKKKGKGKGRKAKNIKKVKKSTKQSKKVRSRKLKRSIKAAKNAKKTRSQETHPQEEEVQASGRRKKQTKAKVDVHATVRKSALKKQTKQHDSEQKQLEGKHNAAKEKPQPAQSKAEVQETTTSKRKQFTKPKKSNTTTADASNDASLSLVESAGLGEELKGVIGVLDDEEATKNKCLSLLTNILKTCADCSGSDGCTGECHDFNMPTCNLVQLSVYWGRGSVGAKIRENLFKESDSLKFSQVAYFSSGPCVYANFVLAKIWVT